MKTKEETELTHSIQRRYRMLRPHLTERQRRLFAATEAKAIGRGGITLVAGATGLSRTTVHQGMAELNRRKPVVDALPASRRPGGGRKNVAVFDPEILPALEQLIGASMGGNSSSVLCWTCRSTRDLAEGLSRQGHPVSHASVAHLMRMLGYRLRGNGKPRDQGSIKEREAQFQHITERIAAYDRAGLPTVCCGLDVEIRDPDGIETGEGRESTLSNEDAWRHAECDARAIERAAHHLERWWADSHSLSRQTRTPLLLCVDSRGCDKEQVATWKDVLAGFANAARVRLEVVHLPPGARRWTRLHNVEEWCARDWRDDHPVRVRAWAGGGGEPRPQNGSGAPRKNRKQKNGFPGEHGRPNEQWNYRLDGAGE